MRAAPLSEVKNTKVFSLIPSCWRCFRIFPMLSSISLTASPYLRQKEMQNTQSSKKKKRKKGQHNVFSGFNLYLCCRNPSRASGFLLSLQTFVSLACREQPLWGIEGSGFAQVGATLGQRNSALKFPKRGKPTLPQTGR